MNENKVPRLRLHSLLTPTERDVAVHLVQGLIAKAIASVMSIRVGTVKVHIRNIYRKVGLEGISDSGFDPRVLLTRSALIGEIDLGAPMLGEGSVVIGVMTL